MSTNRSSRFDVAVVGLGPTGATLANLLAQQGLQVLVLEREEAIYHLPRAVHFDDETMRVFQAVGIADDLKEKVHVNPGMRFIAPDGRLLLDWPRPQDVGPQGWNTSFRLHQPDLEKLLRQKLATHPNVTVLSRCQVIGLTEIGDEVVLTVRGHAGTSPEIITAGHVVGCDGARSTVRQSIGAELEDLGLQERWLVVDVLLKRPRPDLGDHTLQFCNPERPMTYCRSPANRRRWEIMALDHETDLGLTDPIRVWDLLSRWITPQDAELERSAVYTFRSALASKWRKGRILIAGDAAHLTPPFMGQGMCAGIRDASNLAWKLALTIRGDANCSLLDTYQAERSSHARAYITTAINLGKLINSLDSAGVMDLAGKGDGDGPNMKSIAPRLGESDLARLFPPDSRHCGRLFGQPVLSDGRRLDDVVGYAPILVTRKKIVSASDAGPLVINGEDEPSILPFFDRLGVNAVLVRADRYILAHGVDDDDIQALAEIDLAGAYNNVVGALLE